MQSPDIANQYPAPWAYDAEINRVYSVPSNMCVAAPHIPTNPICATDFPPLARLIAAAPDMLEALKAQEEACTHSLEVSDAIPDGEKIPKHIWDKADQLFRRAEKLRRAAIAKAEGRAA